jgi:hypothetical protein
MATELLQIDDLLIDKFNPYTVPGADTFSPGIPKMGGYKGRSNLDWYEPTEDPVQVKEQSMACGMPSVGDYSIDFCVKKPQVLNNQPGWAMEFDGLGPLITSSYGLTTARDSASSPETAGLMYKLVGIKMTNNALMILILGLALVFLLVSNN